MRDVRDAMPACLIPGPVQAGSHVCISPSRSLVIVCNPYERTARAFDSSTAKVRWRCTIPSEIETAGLADDRVIVLLTWKGQLWSIDADTGAATLERARARTLATDSRLPNVLIRPSSAQAQPRWVETLDRLGLRPTFIGADCQCCSVFRSAFTQHGIAVVEGGSRLLESVDYDTGRLQWSAEVPEGTFVQGMMASANRRSVIAIARSVKDGWVADCIWFDARDGAEQARRPIPRGCWAIEAACEGECFVGRNGFLEMATMKHTERSYG